MKKKPSNPSELVQVEITPSKKYCLYELKIVKEPKDLENDPACLLVSLDVVTYYKETLEKLKVIQDVFEKLQDQKNNQKQ